jgi:endonuclease III
MAERPRNSTRKGGSHSPKKATNATPQAIAWFADRLAERWPGQMVELDHKNAYELLVAVILAAQATDKLINTLTPAVFARYPDPASLALADQNELETLVRKSGSYRQKSRHLIAAAQAIVANFGGEVPTTLAGLTSLPGVGRKSANVVLGNALGIAEGVVVDRHVMRVAHRLGITKLEDDPVKLELELMELVPRDRWIAFGNGMIVHGRYVCLAKNPLHDQCPLAPQCPSANLGLVPIKVKPKAAAKPKPKAKAKPKPIAKAKPKRRAEARA